MSTSEIIELNSSDEETEKKPKKKKLRLDAMVAIPNPNITGLKIENPRPFTPLNNFPRVQTVQVGTRIHLPVGITRPNLSHATKIRPVNPPRRANTQFPKIINTMSLNGRPFTQISPKKPTRLNVNPLSIARMAKHCKSQTKSPGQSKGFRDLPPGITVTRTTGQPKRKNVQRPTLPPEVVIKKKTETVTEITLEDDDDVSEVSVECNAQIVPIEFEVPILETSIHANYDNVNNTTEEAENRTEKAPKTPSKHATKQATITEIVIEDSPVKPVVESAAKRLAREEIIIEDSPVKNDSEPENEGDDKTDCNSRKKLDFSKESRNSEEDKQDTTDNVEVSKLENNNLVQNNGKPQKDAEKKDKSTKSEILKPVEHKAKEESEFHETYKKFIEACLKVESSDDMKRIVEKKVKGYYREVDKKLSESPSFVELVNAKILAMEKEPTNSFLHIKDIVDQLSIWRHNQNIVLSAENLDKDQAKQRHLAKLERALQKLHRAIQKLEEREVDFDDDADSVYLLTDRYKARLVRIHDKICELTNTRVPNALPPLILKPPPGAAAGPTAKLQAWVNKPRKSASVLPFPDFHDVLSCVREANTEDQLGWTESQLEEEARLLFTHCGKILQKRRQEMEWRLAASRLPSESDPAECDQGLQTKLQDNEKIAVKREQDVFNTFADRQVQLKLVAEEISEDEAEKTDGSDDDEVIFLEEAPQDDEAGTSKEFPKPVPDEEIKKENSGQENNATVESKDAEKMDTDEDTNEIETRSQQSDSTLKTISSDSEDAFKEKEISDSEKIDLESDEESSIYSVVSDSSQHDSMDVDEKDSNSASCDDSGVNKMKSDSEDVIECLDEESMDNYNQNTEEIENFTNSESSTKIVDLDEETKDVNSTELMNRIVRIDSESLDGQVFLNAESSKATEMCALQGSSDTDKVRMLNIEILEDSVDNAQAAPGSAEVNSEDIVEYTGCSEIENKELSGDAAGSKMDEEDEQNVETEDSPRILETHSLQDKHQTKFEDDISPDKYSEVAELAEDETIEINVYSNTDDVKSSVDTTQGCQKAVPEEDILKKTNKKLNQESPLECTAVTKVTEVTDISKNINNSKEIEQNIEKVLPTIPKSIFSREEKQTIDIENKKNGDSSMDELVNSDIENELLNGNQDLEKEIEHQSEEDMDKLFFSDEENLISEDIHILKDTSEMFEQSNTADIEASSKNNEVLESNAQETDVVMKEI